VSPVDDDTIFLNASSSSAPPCAFGSYGEKAGSSYTYFYCISINTGNAPFGETVDGNLTFQGSETFYATAQATSGYYQYLYPTPTGSAVAVELQFANVHGC